MKTLLYVFIGGGLGSTLRFLVSQYASKWSYWGSFPMGTFLVNILGSLLIGLFASYFLKEQSELKFLFIAGFCGGFTTFSAFAAENISLYQSGQWVMLVVYILLSVLGGLLAVWLGTQSMTTWLKG